MLIATPEYNGSLPGQLKNALDWASRPHATNPFRNKPVAVVGASPGGFGAVWAQADARRILARMGARVLDAELALSHAPSRCDADGRLADEAAVDELESVVERARRRGCRPGARRRLVFGRCPTRRPLRLRTVLPASTLTRVPGGETDDLVAVEEPLEIRINGRAVAVTMRTPGHDEELALGFCLSEGLRPESAAPPADLAANTVDVTAPRFDAARLERSFYTTSSCGVCGKGALEAVAVEAAKVTSGLTADGGGRSRRSPIGSARHKGHSPPPAGCTRAGCSTRPATSWSSARTSAATTRSTRSSAAPSSTGACR